MEESLKEIIKKLKGNLLVVSISNQYILDAINKNKNFDLVYSLERTKFFQKPERNDKSIKLKKLKKLKKKVNNNIDYMIVDVNGINIDMRKVLYNTYNLIDKQIIYYGVYDEYDVDLLIKKYDRFNCKCEKKMYKNKFILLINMKEIKVSKLFLYKILDSIIDIVEGIGNLLMG